MTGLIIAITDGARGIGAAAALATTGARRAVRDLDGGAAEAVNVIDWPAPWCEQ